MESQGERELGVLGMDVGLVESMVQDEIPEQEMLVVQDELPQPNPESEMGAAAEAMYDTPLPHLRQIPSPAPSETATDNGGSVLLEPSVIARMVEMITQAMEKKMETNACRMENKIDGVNKQMETNTNEIKTNACRMNNNMEANTQTLRGEMQRMGLELQKGQGALKEELKKAEGKMTKYIGTIRAEVNVLKGKVKEVRSAMEAGKE